MFLSQHCSSMIVVVKKFCIFIFKYFERKYTAFRNIKMISMYVGSSKTIR